MTTATLFPTAGTELESEPTLPRGARGVVVLAHGAGSSRRSPRTRQVAAELTRRELATLLFEEPGALEIVAEEAGTWFAAHLR